MLRQILTNEALTCVVQAFITSRLDCCNSILLGASAKLITMLQRNQNITERIITGCQKYGHITPVLKELPWLPVNERIQLKTLVLTYKSLNGQAPACLAELIHEKVNTRALRSSGKLIIDDLTSQNILKTFGSNSSSVSCGNIME